MAPATNLPPAGELRPPRCDEITRVAGDGTRTAASVTLGNADPRGAPIGFEFVQGPRASGAFATVRLRRTDVARGGLSIAAVGRTL